MLRKIRKRIYFAVEGESEQSFIKFLQQQDGWSLEQLISEANKKHFDVCLQRPNMDGLLLRLFPGNEHRCAHASFAHKQLLKVWNNYQKPADARTLMSKFSNDDLIRAAKADPDLKDLLTKIGLKNN